MESREDKDKENNDFQEEEILSKPSELIGRGIKYFVFTILCLIHSFLGLSGSVISSCAVTIKSDLLLSDKQFGSLGTFQGTGNALGSFLYTILNEKISRKTLFLFSMSLNTCFHLCFFLTNNYYLLCCVRFISGIGQVVGYCYFPVWIDQFNIPEYRTLMTTIMNLSGTVGGVWGYLINIFITSKKWRFGLSIETMLIMTCVVILILTPGKYLNKEERRSFIKKKKKSRLPSSHNSSNNLNTSTETIAIVAKEKDTTPSSSSSSSTNEKTSPSNNNDTSSVDSSVSQTSNSSPNVNKSEEDGDYEPSVQRDLLCNLTFMAMGLYKSNVFFIDMAQNYWFGDYIQEVFEEKDPKKMFYAFTFGIIATQIAGMIIGGFIGTAVIGGSASPRNLTAMILFQAICCVFAVIAPNMNGLLLFSIFNGMYHFFNNMASLLCVPYTLGLVDYNLKGTASGIFFLLNELFAFLPAPFVYGAVKSFVGSGKTTMRLLLYYNCIGLVLLLLANFGRKLGKSAKKEETKEKFTKVIKIVSC